MNVHVAILHTEQGCLLYYTSVWLFWLLSHFFDVSMCHYLAQVGMHLSHSCYDNSSDKYWYY